MEKSVKCAPDIDLRHLKYILQHIAGHCCTFVFHFDEPINTVAKTWVKCGVMWNILLNL